MTAIEAMIYCLESVSDVPEDGEYQSQVAYDKYGYEHWFAWRVNHGKRAKPLLQSSSDVNPFAEILEPYTTSRQCDHPRLNMDGICFTCGRDCRGMS